MIVSFNKFDEFLQNQGYNKTIEGNRILWKHPVRLELSQNNLGEQLPFTYEPDNKDGLVQGLGLEKEFKQYFKIE